MSSSSPMEVESQENDAPQQTPTTLSSLLDQSDLPLEDAINAVASALFKNEGLSRTCPLTLESVALLKSAASPPELTPQTPETLNILAQIMNNYTAIGSEGAIIAARLLAKLVKLTEPAPQLLELICDQMMSFVAAKAAKKVDYYFSVLKLVLSRLELSEELFLIKLGPLMSSLAKDVEKGAEYAEFLAKSVQFEWIINFNSSLEYFVLGLKRRDWLACVIPAIEKKVLKVNDGKFMKICERIADMDVEDFDEFIYYLMDYLIRGWEEQRNFEVLGIIVEMLDVVLKLTNDEVIEAITNALYSIDMWHVKILVCWSLFGPPEGELEEKSESSLPLELYLCHKTGDKPEDSLIQRIYSVKNDLIYKFCVLVLQQLFNIEEITEFELEMEDISENIRKLVEKFGAGVVPRIRRVLSQELRVQQ